MVVGDNQEPEIEATGRDSQPEIVAKSKPVIMRIEENPEHLDYSNLASILDHYKDWNSENIKNVREAHPLILNKKGKPDMRIKQNKIIFGSTKKLL